MTSNIATMRVLPPSTETIDESRDWQRYLVPIGRALFALIFIMSGFTHFSAASIGYATQVGLPFAGLLVPASGIVAMVGGLSVLLGYRVRIGAWLLVLFLIPVTLTMHNFWSMTDPMMAQIHMAMFMKNVSMLGGALLLAHWGAGPVSLDARRNRAADRHGQDGQ